MTKIDLKKLIAYWVNGSKLDFESAVAISEKAKKNVQACFFLHLAIEKVLKAYIVHRTKQHAPYLHNLSQLGKLTDLDFSIEQLKLLIEINDFNMRCRYPDERFSIYKTATPKKTAKLILQGQEFIQWILEKLNK